MDHIGYEMRANIQYILLPIFDHGKIYIVKSEAEWIVNETEANNGQADPIRLHNRIKYLGRHLKNKLT